MFDLAGYIPGKNPLPKFSFAAAWAGYAELIGHAFERRDFDPGGVRLQALYRPGEPPDTAASDDYFVAVYGFCARRLDAAAPGPGGRLRATDLLEGYTREGRRLLPTLKGSFILLVADRRRGTVHLISDPLSVRPLYFQQGPAGVLFSTSLRALRRLLAEQGAEPDVDPVSVLEYHLFDFTLGGHTPLRGIRALQAGEILRVEGGTLSIERYTDPHDLFPLSRQRLDERASTRRLAEVLQSNIALLNEGPERTAVALTGGYDSRSIAALLGEEMRSYAFYSYGDPKSWDVRIPRQLARDLGLDYTFIDLTGDFRSGFAEYARRTVALGDGRAEASRANYLYVYSRALRDKTSILSGLFGSELIKTPSSRGLFIDEPMLAVLRAEQPEAALDRLLTDLGRSGLFDPDLVARHRDELFQRVLGHPLVGGNGTNPRAGGPAAALPERLFYFILMVGCRKYFAKEINLERYYLDNRAPFFDIDFIRALLRTPFPWVYNWSEEKSLVKNLKIHRVYAGLIAHHPALLNVLTTHGFKPKYLLSAWRYPQLVAQFYRVKRQIARASRLRFDRELRAFFAAEPPEPGRLPVHPKRLEALADTELKNYVKLRSLQTWLAS